MPGFQKPNLLFLNHLLDAYVEQRILQTSSLTGMASAAWTMLKQNPNDLTGTLAAKKELSALFTAANKQPSETQQAKAWVEIILEAGKKAFIAQSVSSYPSKFCTALHAISSDIFETLKKSEIGQEAILEKVRELGQEVTQKKSAISSIPDNARNRPEKLKLATEDFSAARRNLVYLMDSNYLNEGVINSLFTGLEYPKEANGLSLTSQNKDILNYTLPFIFQNNYIHIYISQEFGKGEKLDLESYRDKICEETCDKLGLVFQYSGNNFNTDPARQSVNKNTLFKQPGSKRIESDLDGTHVNTLVPSLGNA